MKIGIIVPTRGDRNIFLNQLKKYIANQTLKPYEVLFVDYEPKNDEIDITERYKFGYNHFRNKGFDLLALMEDDDFYREDYLQIMVGNWLNNGKPDIIGQNKTIYYNLNIKKWLVMNHTTRSSAMNTLIKPDLDFTWCKNNEPYTDIHLWNTIKNNCIIKETEIICMGIKHGIGKCGGYMHTNKLERYKFQDENLIFLKEVTGDDFEFYKNLIGE